MSQANPSEALFTRAEVQRGLPEKRASLLLFLIECAVMQHTARLQTLVALAGAMPEAGVWPAFFVADDLLSGSEDIHDPIGALKLARRGHGSPTIWEIERYARAWATGVPPTPQVRAATARLLAQKYHFTTAMAPGIRYNLGLDTAPVQAAFEALYAAPLATIYAPQVTLADHLARLAAKLQDALASIDHALRKQA